ncbi:MAG: 2-oxo acid dehydrogenase subunit E2 [Clostridia bacterium]|nr:2-oxo acid dehydrogenase subunit E2 [Clostridia bacterium]
MFGRRPDGRRLDHIDPIVQFMPFIMTQRNDAMNQVTQYVDYEPLGNYIKKRSKVGQRVSFMSLIVAAYVRAVSKYPALNRFIVNKQVFARNEISIALTVLRNQGDKENLDEAIVKMAFEPDATVDDVEKQLNENLKDAVNSEADNETADFAAKLIRVRPLVQLVVWAAKLLDRYGIMPKFIHRISPFHVSMVITNMASIGMPAIYHHLYNFGNASIFIAMGKIERQTVYTKDGVKFKNMIPLGIVMDERICGGAAYAQGMNYFRKLLENPEELEKKPEVINYDYDFSKLKARKKAKEEKKAKKKQK